MARPELADTALGDGSDVNSFGLYTYRYRSQCHTLISLRVIPTVCFFHSDANHEVKMFNELPKGDFIDETSPLPPCFRLPAARRTYIGGRKIWVSLWKFMICFGYLLTKRSRLSMTQVCVCSVCSGFWSQPWTPRATSPLSP